MRASPSRLFATRCAPAEALVEVRPTILPSVPRVFEKAHAAVLARFDEASGPRRRLAEWALRVGREASRLRQAGRPLPRSLARRVRLADRLVYSKVKERFGGRLRIAISGGAPLSPEIGEFFHAFDLLILEGYGLTECTTACSVNLPGRYRFGTVGPLLPGVEARFDERRGAPRPQRNRVRGLLPRRGGDARRARRRGLASHG